MCKVKICGLTRPEDIAMVNNLQPDYIGFVFAKSRRQVTVERAKVLKSMLLPDILVVGVFVEQSVEEIALLLDSGVIDVAQLHGAQTEDDIIQLKKMTNQPVIQAISVQSADDVLAWQNSKADYLLLDNGAGGSGKPFPWAVLTALDGLRKPYFLAGGLHPDNVQQAAAFHPYAVDVSSGVEVDGVKNNDKMQLFINKLRCKSSE